MVDFGSTKPKLIIETKRQPASTRKIMMKSAAHIINGLGFTFLRFWNHEILQLTEKILAEILRVAQKLELRQPEKYQF
ncbi:DUF559 domain-containing protein [Kingella kingae]|uniref:DUF559 domain-containing protein n=1 Tax=Kingella kingae TaxID=504 RepID=UPI0039B006F9